MSREDLTSTLCMLRNGRRKLVNAFCSEDHELYVYIFSLANDSAEMELAMNKYFFEWLGAHSTLPFEEYSNDQLAGLSPKSTDYFLRAYKRLCEKFIAGESSRDNLQSGALIELVKHKITNLNQLLDINMRHEEKLKRLQYLKVKERFLFNRLFASLQE